MRTLFEQHDSAADRAKDFLIRHKVAVAAVGVLLALGIAASVGYDRFAYAQQPDPDFHPQVAQPAYTAEHPEVLFDAAHINFHTPDGNYKPFADLIRSDGFVVVPNTRKFTAESLRGARVLVIANALGIRGASAMLLNLVGYTKALQWDLDAFSPEECKVLRDWVFNGGGLLLISDHAPTGSAARQLAAQFGVDMSNWFTEDDQHSDPDAYSFLIFSRENGLLLEHPVTAGRNSGERVNRIVTFTGQSLKGPADSTPFLALAPSAREYPFRESTLAEGRSAAGRAQGVALSYGEGRVVVLGEAAMLSAQIFRVPGREIRLGMEYPGCDNRQLALNIMHWLSQLTN
jgi:hypothetical protein